LNLHETRICDDGAKAIADALKVNHGLKTLDVSFNNIYDDGAKHIAHTFKVNHHLKELNLRENKISDNGKDYLTNIEQELDCANRDVNMWWERY
jgi:Ran GTPase-activating protein (RanGAP) involved in mRNA processing and transport